MKEGRIRESTRGGGRQRGRGGGPDAIKKAKREDKPIFLSIGYFACHWCQVMAHESFEDEDIAVLMNEHFVSIKVDREERPDIDEIYKQATMSMTQRGGVGRCLSS